MSKKIERNINDIINTNKILKKIKKGNQIYYQVECTLCGRVRQVRSDNLKQQCRSCAAKQRDRSSIRQDLTNQKFGLWTVLYKAPKNNYWHCKCECGTEKDVFMGSLKSGQSKSCGCIRSWGEQQIIYLLNKYQILYKKEIIFNDLITEKGGYPRFDFGIYNNQNKLICLIEYDGRQHFYYNKNWNQTLEAFNRTQLIDQLKNNYCNNKGIKLYRFNKGNDLEKEIYSILKEQNLLNTNKGVIK